MRNKNTVQIGEVTNVVSFRERGLYLEIGYYVVSGYTNYEVNLTVDDELVLCDVRPNLKSALQLFTEWLDSEDGLSYIRRTA